MWKASAGHQVNSQPVDDASDDWETDPDFVNDVTEQEQRWGSKTIEGSGRTAGAIDMKQLRAETEQNDAKKKAKEIEEANPGYGYGGKFGVETDRMDNSAMGHDYIGKVEKHASQKDYSDGFGGKFGVQTDRVDKSALNWDHKEKLEKHSSQKDYATGFGGKFGVQSDRVDKSALGWDHVEKVEKHESQKDYSKGFGGKFGVQEDRKDKSALGWDHVEANQKHESQLDHKVGFGGKFGVQKDRMDKSAIGFQENPDRIGTSYTKTKPDIGAAKPSNLRAKFENLAKSSEEDTQKRLAEQKRIREEKDKFDREAAEKRQTYEEPSSKTVERKTIDTGRAGGIGNAISAFNQTELATEIEAIRKEPIKLPPAEIPAPAIIQPDLIPTNEPTIAEPKVAKVEEPEPQVPEPVAVEQEIREEIPVQTSSNQVTQEAIYQNQDELFIEDTGVKAIALFDYQAAAEDEISFDPDDLISHIEMIDEGWWRGLCKSRYGLFPANYVQLQE